MRTSRNTFRIVLLFLSLILGTGCKTAPEAPLRIGMNTWPGYEALFLAQEKGLLTTAGINVQIVEYSSLGDVLRAFIKGQIDGMASTLIEVLQACDQSARCPQVVLVTDFSDGADVILTHQAITEIAGLRGKRIAVESGSLGTFMLARALATASMALADVILVPMDQTRMSQGLAAGTVDAVVTYPPASVEILRRGGVNTLFTSSDIPGEVIDVVTVGPQILAARPTAAAGLVRAWDLALHYMREHPDEAHRLMAAREHISPAEFRQALTGIRLLDSQAQRQIFTANGTLQQTIKAVDQVLRRTGQLRGLDRTSGLLAKAVLELQGGR